ncbi:MAG: 6-phosphogluconolactonase [Halobacteriaceae archaeon]
MDPHQVSTEELLAHDDIEFSLVEDKEALDRKIAREIADLVAANNAAGEPTDLVLPVGPLDYEYLANVVNRDRVRLDDLTVYMMDEYLDDEDAIIPEDHPLSFHAFVRENLVGNLADDLGFSMDDVVFPDPDDPGAVTEEIEAIDGCDACYGGFGITGHFAFNDPPRPGESMTAEEMADTRTRKLTIMRESTTQMAMGGTLGTWDIIPERAVTLGMYEMLMSDKIHLTFMRDWHAGTLRRALLGPVTAECPGSLIQDHPNFEVTMTEIAAQRPLPDVTQATGEEEG